MSRRRSAYALAAAAMLSISAAAAQQEFPSPFGDQPFKPFRPKRKGPAPPRIELRRDDSIPLPGPLPGEAPTVDGDTVTIAVADGLAVVSLATAEVRTVPRPGDPPEADPWTYGGKNDRYRFRALDEGVLLAEKRCRRCRRTWKKAWRLRVPGTTHTRPLTLGKRVYFGSSDNRVYAVRVRNGHRFWDVDVDDRVVLPPTAWRGELPTPRKWRPKKKYPQRATYDILLVVPEDRRSVLAIDPFDGRLLTTFKLSDPESRLTAPAVPTPDGRILLARQGYNPADAALVVLRLAPLENPPASGDDLPYNGPSPDDEGNTAGDSAGTEPDPAPTGGTSPASRPDESTERLREEHGGPPAAAPGQLAGVRSPRARGEPTCRPRPTPGS